MRARGRDRFDLTGMPPLSTLVEGFLGLPGSVLSFNGECRDEYNVIVAGSLFEVAGTSGTCGVKISAFTTLLDVRASAPEPSADTSVLLAEGMFLVDRVVGEWARASWRVID